MIEIYNNFFYFFLARFNDIISTYEHLKIFKHFHEEGHLEK